MSQVEELSQDLHGFEEIVSHSLDSHTGVSDVVRGMTIDSDGSCQEGDDDVSKSSQASSKSVRSESGKKKRDAAVVANERIVSKRKCCSSSSSSVHSLPSSISSYRETKRRKTTKQSGPIFSKGDIMIYGLVVKKKTGQVFYPQDSMFVVSDTNDELDNIKEQVDENKKKWEKNGHVADIFSHTFEGIIPNVVGGFTRGFMKSSFK